MSQKVVLDEDRVHQGSLFVLDHKDGYRQIRNYLAGRLVGATRDESLLEEVVKCLFCKLYLHIHSVESSDSANVLEIADSYRQAFTEVRQNLPVIFRPMDELALDPESIVYIDQILENIDLADPARDPVGDLYEAFIGTNIRGQEGQFFTPHNAIRLLVSIIDPQPSEKIIDPACGAGGFLSAAARHLLAAGATHKQVAETVFGIDKDRYLAALASSHVSVVTLEPTNIYCADSLAWLTEEDQVFALQEQVGKFDIALSNPPFGARIVAVSQKVQRLFDLGHRWQFDTKAGRFVRTQELQPLVPPQVLFIERILSLVRPGGRIGMVVPESLISGKNYRYVVQYIREHARIRAIMGMPESLFKTSGKGGTHTKTCLLVLEKKDASSSQDTADTIFMAEAQWCGHDSRGRLIGHDELPEIAAEYRKMRLGEIRKNSHLGYTVPSNQLIDNILAPRYYNPDVADELSLLRNTHDLVAIGDLVSSGLLQITTGDEIGKLVYGTGTIPFVRTSDISNWEIKLDPKHSVSDEVYEALARKQDVREGDILMVRDGTYLIGTCAFITKYDTRILFQSHLYKLRVLDPSKLSPYLLLAALSSQPVRRQIKAKRFTQDIIDSLGSRIHELVLPIPKDKAVQNRWHRETGCKQAGSLKVTESLFN